MNTRQAAGRQEVAAGSWASLEASWAIEGSSGVAGCSGVRVRWEVAAGLWALLEVSWAMLQWCSRV